MENALAEKETAKLQSGILKEAQNYFNAVQRDVEFGTLKKCVYIFAGYRINFSFY